MPDVNRFGIVAVATAFAVLASFSAGWIVNGWRLGTALAEAREQRATEREALVRVAFNDLAEGVSRVRAAAEQYTTERTAIAGQLEQLTREFRTYAKQQPLPADCRPDEFRVRSLNAAVSAAQQASTARQ